MRSVPPALVSRVRPRKGVGRGPLPVNPEVVERAFIEAFCDERGKGALDEVADDDDDDDDNDEGKGGAEEEDEEDVTGLEVWDRRKEYGARCRRCMRINESSATSRSARTSASPLPRGSR